jgi:ATP-binding cassette subfamily C (CFTR/MRP) protein 1
MKANNSFYIVRHLPLADKVVVLGSDGSILEQGTFEDLRSQDGFISKLLLHPELLLSHTNTGVGDNIESKKKPTISDNKPIRGAAVNDTADLTRRIGDLSVYKYYLKSIGWKIALTIASACIISSLAQTFPRKSLISGIQQSYSMLM